MDARRRGLSSTPASVSQPATSSPIIDAARAFLALLEEAPPFRPGTLARALDQIAVASHGIPTRRYSSRRGRPALKDLIKRGPQLPVPSYYTVVDPLEGTDQQPYCGSMADHIADIRLTMIEAVWRFEHNGRGEAHAFLRTMQHHWELHLRELSMFLYAIRFRNPAKRRL